MKNSYVILFIVLFLCSVVTATIVHVPGDQPTIQAGIDSASTGDTVLVAQGEYFENISFKGKAITLGSLFIMNGDSNYISNTIINGSQPTNPDSGSVVYFISGADTNSILTGFTVTGGSGTINSPPIFGEERIAGGILCWNSGAKITHNKIQNNQISNSDYSFGGGILAAAEVDLYQIILEQNTIQFNTLNSDSLSGGGGLFIGIDSRIRNNLIQGNYMFSQGYSYGSGALFANLFGEWGTVDFSNNIVLQNASVGQMGGSGAVHIEFGDAAVAINEVRYNTVEFGMEGWGAGILMVLSDGNSSVRDNIIENNSTLNGETIGGGLSALFTFQLRIQGNKVKNNDATYGGGIGTLYSSPVIQSNLIAKNSASEGGGLWLTKFPFANNLDDSRVEEILNRVKRRLLDYERTEKRIQNKIERSQLIQTGDTQIINNTVAENSASETGGAVQSKLGVAMIMNSILWNNSASSGNQIAGTAIVNFSGVQEGFPGLGNIDQNPEFADTINYYLTSPTSPCIDAGNPDSAYDDLEDPGNPGFPLWPALGTLRNDMGTFGGNPDVTPPSGLIFGPLFRAFVNRVNSVPSPQRPAIVDSFMNAVPSFPFIEQDKIAYFLYRGTVNSVNVPGDMNNWDPAAFPMTQLAGTTLWYQQQVFEPDARLDYKFVRNGNDWILDPLNPRQVSGGFGPNSELAMPMYVDPPEIEYYPGIPHGALHDTVFYSAILNNSRLVRVYTPPFYDSMPNDSFPMALFHDGLEYISLASARNVLDYLISENRIQPIIAVFVPPVDRNNEYAFSKTAQFSLFIRTELMPVIDSLYRTIRDSSQRAMVGISYGGLITTQICYNHPEDFGLAAPFSPAYAPKNGEVYLSVINGPKKDLKWYLDWGTYEPGIMYDCRNLRDFFMTEGYPLEWNEWHEGHSWGSWRAHLDHALEYFFPGAAVSIPINDVIIARFELFQNFPNPFNATTTINYQLAVGSVVELTIYNLLGQQIRTLINAKQSAGPHQVRWDGRDESGNEASSGVYFYQLKAGNNFTDTKKMMVLK